ncbi:hypothetical protein OS493_003175 [Desmophyllum pertusum]|uniref:Uncharacterized protein n=1 Tax=Desmophyllum pertusum TaxID=174260 RepID=A0A9W9YJV0_9CNID|nr:hypothetical protein OS493_003175 [Desmophyllum pertusum]
MICRQFEDRSVYFCRDVIHTSCQEYLSGKRVKYQQSGRVVTTENGDFCQCKDWRDIMLIHNKPSSDMFNVKLQWFQSAINTKIRPEQASWTDLDKGNHVRTKIYSYAVDYH